ncbi:MAG: single-stranded DNA-binding protein [Firmicutes bacterium]|nr:single-stranded DNA-binding protein [Bacillota bacterium]
MNKAFLIGNLTRDPELKQIQNGASVCNFAIAVNRKYTSADGTRQTDFFNIIAWRALGENCAKFLKKGSKVGVVGEIQTRSYEAQDGSKRYVTEINADEVEFLSPKQQDGNMGGSSAAEDGMQPVSDDNLPF